jgi:hypothetical protein
METQDRAREWAEQQRASWEAATHKSEETFREMISHIEQARDYHAQQSINWEATTEALRREIIQIEQARDYHAQQAINWEAASAEYRSQSDQLSEQLLHVQAERDQLHAESLLRSIARRMRTVLASQRQT